MMIPLQLKIKRPFFVGLGVGALTLLASLFIPNYYRSEARVLSAEGKAGAGLGNLVAAAAAFGVGIPGQDGAENNYIDIINSRWMRESLIQTEYDFKIRSWRFGAERRFKGTLAQYMEVNNLDQGVRRISRLVVASKDVKTRILLLSVETKSPELSQQIVKRALQLLDSFVSESGRTRGGRKAEFAERRLLESQEEYLKAEHSLSQFLEHNRNFQTTPDPVIHLKGLRLEGELKLRQQLVSALALSREQALLDEKNDLPILNILDSGNLPHEKSRPDRVAYVLISIFIAWFMAFVFENWNFIKIRIFYED